MAHNTEAPNLVAQLERLVVGGGRRRERDGAGDKTALFTNPQPRHSYVSVTLMLTLVLVLVLTLMLLITGPVRARSRGPWRQAQFIARPKL